MSNLTSFVNPLDNITRIEYKGHPVLTYEQLAEILSAKGDKAVTVNNLQANFRHNRDRFVEGVHYFKLEGDELAAFKNCLKNFPSVIAPNTAILYLWTKRGVARHCKSVGTEMAWDVYESLEDKYFNPADRDAPLESVSDFERGKALVGVAQAARDPYTKKRLVAKAANLILGEEFIPVPARQPELQVTLFA